MIQNCKEQILDDIVRVDFLPADGCHLPVPFQETVTEMNIPGLEDWTPQSTDHPYLAQAQLSLSYQVADGDDGEIESAPKMTQNDKRQSAGIIVSHDLQIPLTAGFIATRQAVALVQLADYHIVLTTADGERYMVYAIPNTAQVLLDESNLNQQATVKATLQSASHIIHLY